MCLYFQTFWQIKNNFISPNKTYLKISHFYKILKKIQNIYKLMLCKKCFYKALL